MTEQSASKDDQARPLAEIEIVKNGRGDVLRLTIQEYRGHRLVSARIWFQNRDTGELRPSRDGFGVNIALLPKLIEGLQHLAEPARAIGWIPADGTPGADPSSR